MNNPGTVLKPATCCRMKVTCGLLKFVDAAKPGQMSSMRSAESGTNRMSVDSSCKNIAVSLNLKMG